MMKKLTPLRIVLIYISAYVLWIVSTDILVTNIPMSDDARVKISVSKGILSVLVSAYFLYWIISQYIQQRKRLEEALKEREVFLNKLLNAISVPVFYKDRDGRYLGFNRAFETFFGETRERLIGKSVFDINPPELAKIYHAKDAELLASGGVQQYESQVKNTHSLMRDVIFNKAVFTDSQGTVCGLIGAILDITERKQVEQERDLLIEKLQKALAEIKTLKGILPICAVCKKIRDDKDVWKQMEVFISEHSGAKFSHGYCPECAKLAVKEVEHFIKEKPMD